MKTILQIMRYIFVVFIIGTIVATIGGAGFFLLFSKGLPTIITIDDYKPFGVTRVYGKKDVVVGEFFEQIRYVVPYEQFPDHVVKSFVAAEDDRFFEHQGIDFLGMLRAALVNLKAGHVVQGGSTITQQVAKSILLTPERSFTRKIKEVVLASRMEKNLTKKQILYLYLNQIYFGEGAYGVEAASRLYFNKPAKEMSLAEAAILAGLPQAPSRYSPLHNAKRSKERQIYVLHRLAEIGAITRAEEQQASKVPLKIFYPKSINDEYSPYYLEYLRQYLLDKYGKEKLYHQGLIVKTPLDPELSRAATKSVQEGLRNVDKRHGYRGPLERVHGASDTSKALDEILEYNIRSKVPYKLLLPDGIFAKELSKRVVDFKSVEDILSKDEIYKALVTQVDDVKKEAVVDLGIVKAVMPLEKMKWAYPAKKDFAVSYDTIVRPGQAVAAGDVILVKVSDLPSGKQKNVLVSLEQNPAVQGALLSIDNNTGEVLTMVGGYNFDTSEFNRATQAERQPGSAFKAVIYSAAVDRGYTPATVIQDSPLVFNSGDNEKWKPLNYDEHFSGDITFRWALIKSLNIPSIKIVQDIGIPWLLDYAKRVGITKGLNPDYSIALGSLSVSLLDLVKVYSIYPRGGRKIRPVFLRSVLDRDGKILEEIPLNPPAPELNPNLLPPPKAVTVAGQLAAEARNTTESSVPLQWAGDPADPDRVMDPRTAYVMTHLMNEVATVGTGAEAKNLKRAAAGKTGTTNDYMDAWFMGFTPQVTTGVWVGFDQQRTLGSKGTGGLTALPIWLDYMREAVKGYPDIPFNVPPGVSFAYINGTSGRLVSASSPGAVREAFISGTEPGRSGSSYSGSVRTSNKAEDSHTEDFLKQDFQ